MYHKKPSKAQFSHSNHQLLLQQRQTSWVKWPADHSFRLWGFVFHSPTSWESWLRFKISSEPYMQKMLSIRQMLVYKKRDSEHLIFYTNVKPKFKGHFVIWIRDVVMVPPSFFLLLCRVITNKKQELTVKRFKFEFQLHPRPWTLPSLEQSLNLSELESLVIPKNGNNNSLYSGCCEN